VRPETVDSPESADGSGSPDDVSGSADGKAPPARHRPGGAVSCRLGIWTSGR